MHGHSLSSQQLHYLHHQQLSCSAQDDVNGRKTKRGVLPKHATEILRSWLFSHIVVGCLQTHFRKNVVLLKHVLVPGRSYMSTSLSKFLYHSYRCFITHWFYMSANQILAVYFTCIGYSYLVTVTVLIECFIVFSCFWNFASRPFTHCMCDLSWAHKVLTDYPGFLLVQYINSWVPICRLTSSIDQS